MTLALPSAASAGLGCHAAFRFPGNYFDGDTYDAVQVLNRVNVSCDRALRVGATAYALPHLKQIFGPQYGAGGYGGPFHFGRWHCSLLSRGSDFIDARCREGRASVHFYDHRQYFSIPEPGWSGPPRRI